MLKDEEMQGSKSPELSSLALGKDLSASLPAGDHERQPSTGFFSIRALKHLGPADPYLPLERAEKVLHEETKWNFEFCQVLLLAPPLGAESFGNSHCWFLLYLEYMSDLA